MKQSRKHTIFLFSILGVTAILLLLIDMATGDTFIPIAKVWAVLTGGECDEMTRNILFSIRFVRVVVASLIGIALSVSGLQMQTVFQNPLADPYLLGVSSGAGLGVALFILGAPLLGWSDFPMLQSMGIVGSGWIGTAVILLGVAIISRKVKNILGVLIMGVMIGYVAGAIIQILQYLSSAEQLKMFTLWSMGSLSHITTGQLWLMIPIVCIGLFISIACIKPLNLLLLGENYARSMGMNIKRSRTLIFISTALLTGTVTAFCGPVGFIGLAVPHITRLLFNNADHRILVPGTMLTGLISMLLCDIIAKKFTLPVNCITALLGVPVILWVIAKNLRIIK
ncbi:FecCD family ABC transporter permease [Bacteroides congonensis]|uniref:FecCD family ABC transporter permease n=1 Tax=Bacteroides congonensis TaxID=1871006 RepID=UPI000933F01E|nr:iron ABC transporter permease [Bacteroides congonensis]